MGLRKRLTAERGARHGTSWAWGVGVACMMAVIASSADAQEAKPKATVGLYYFDGWSGKTDRIHLPQLLKTKYADRKPVWGWYDDTVEIMQKQIDYCADHGIAFWAFDWYYPEGKNKDVPENNALGLYLKAPNSQRLKFCLLVANHGGFSIGPKDWDACCEKWIELFRQPTHLRLDGQPLLIFFSPEELQRAFGGVEGVRKALESLRAKAKMAGLPGVAVAACTGPSRRMNDWARSGYTLLTGYNYSFNRLNGGGQPFRKLIEGNERIFDQFADEDTAPLCSYHHGRLGLSSLGGRQAFAGQNVPLVSRPHTQDGRGVRSHGSALDGQASRKGHARAAPVDLRME